MQENEDGLWSESIPLPYYGFRKKCSCGAKFWTVDGYKRHYRLVHTDNIKYRRLPDGWAAVERFK